MTETNLLENTSLASNDQNDPEYKTYLRSYVEQKKLKYEMIKREQEEYRNSLVIYKNPLGVLTLFFDVCMEFIKYNILYPIMHNKTLENVLRIIMIIELVLFFIFPPQYNALVFNSVKFIVWWLLLGIMSSIGFGTGMQSGVLFLFPHTMFVCLAASECKSLNFTSWTNMWFNKNNAFVCTEDQTDVTFFGIYLKIILPWLLWGTGTAIGEIPPYLISRAAKLAGKETNNIINDAMDDNKLEMMKRWMIRIIERYGFGGVLFFASYPNAFFDLCGVCCGTFLMPFKTFFSAVFIGKALIKTHMQLIFFITIFYERHLDYLIYLIDLITMKQSNIKSILHNIIESVKTKINNKTENNVSLDWFNMITLIFMIMFLISCMHQFVKSKQYKIDQTILARYQ